MYTLGRQYKEDKRDKEYPIKQVKFSANKRKKTWNDGKWLGDQGDTPACVGFAWAHWLTSRPISQFAQPTGIYTLAQFLDEWESEDYDGTSVRAGAKVLKHLGFIKEYRWANSINDVINTILNTGPVVVGTIWTENMFDTEDGFLIPTGEIVGGHAYLLFAVDTKNETFTMKNSWGRNWGNNGYAYIDFSDFEILLKEDGETCLGIESKPSFSGKFKNK